MTENEKRKEGDDLMTCFVIHVSLLSLHIFRNSCFTKRLVVYHPLTNLSFAAVGFLLIIETLKTILPTKRSVKNVKKTRKKNSQKSHTKNTQRIL